MLPLLLLLEIIMFVLIPLFLRLSSEIVVEAGDYLDQSGPVFWKFLNGYNVFNALGQSLIELYHFSPFVPDYPNPILYEPGQILGHRSPLPKI